MDIKIDTARKARRERCIEQLRIRRESVARTLVALGAPPEYTSEVYHRERASTRQYRMELRDELLGIERLLEFYSAAQDVTTNELTAQAAIADKLLNRALLETATWRAARLIFDDMTASGALPKSLDDVPTTDVDGHGYPRPKSAESTERAAAELGVKLETDA